MQIMRVGLVALLFVFMVSVPVVSLAQDESGDPNDGISLTNPLCDDSDDQCLVTVLTTIIQGLLQLAIPAVTILTVIGGFQMLFAGGDPGKFAAGKKTIMYAVIGFLVILFAQGLTGIIGSIFGVY